MKIRIPIRMGLIRTGVLTGIGSLTNKNTFKGGAHSKGVLIGRRSLNQITTVVVDYSLFLSPSLQQLSIPVSSLVSEV